MRWQLHYSVALNGTEILRGGMTSIEDRLREQMVLLAINEDVLNRCFLKVQLSSMRTYSKMQRSAN